MQSNQSLLQLAAAALLAVCFILGATPVFAQFDSATVLGTIRDANGAVLPNVTVTLKNIATGISATAQTDGDGNYQFVNVRIGAYRVSAEMQGFATAVAERVEVVVNARQRVDLTMQPGQVTETIVISDAAQLLETDSSTRGQVVQRQQIVNLPLNGRNYSNLVLLAPGVRESSQNSGLVGLQGREGAFNVNGLRNTVNNFMLDGIDNNAYGTSNQSFSTQVVQLSPDAVAEFKVQTNTYSAEFGRSGGAIINASYRSGTNDFHGALWEFHRNTVLNAVGFFKPVSGVKPSLIRNQFGGVLGGPIVRDRAFFFLDYEGFRQIQKQLVFSTLPTPAQREGILTVDVRDPFTGTLYRAGERIPLTPFARKVLSELPALNVPGVASNNYSELVPFRAFNDKFNVKLDGKLNESLTSFVRLSHRKLNNFEGPNIPGPSGSNQNGFVYALNQQLASGVTWTLRNTSVLEARLGISRIQAGKRPPLSGGPSMRELYGITGLPDDRTITGGLTTQTITGFSQLGRQATNPQFQNPFSVNPRVNYSWTMGRHSLKAGYEFNAINTDVQDTNPLMGLDTYNRQFSRPTGVAANNLYNLADFYFGARGQYELASLLVVHMRQRYHFTYIQDDFKVNQRLTLNLGMRYEYATPYYEGENRLSNYDPVSNSIIQARDGSIYDRALVDPDRNNFAPRLGLAYTVNDKTVVRAGYGIGYIHFNRIGSADLLATNFPQITRANVQNPAPTASLCTGNAFNNCFRPTQQGYPTGLPNGVVLFIPRELRTGYIQNWQLSVQRELSSNMLIDVAYVGNHALKLILLADYNQARPNLPGENLSLAARRPLKRPDGGDWGTISAVLPAAYSNYHGLQVKFERRFAQGLYVLNSFTWSKTIDNAAQVLEEPGGNTGTPQNVYNIAADRGRSAYDQPFINVTSFVWELPFGRGRAWASNWHPLTDAFIGGWTLTGINTARSGQNVNLRYTPSPVTANLPSFIGGVALRPNLLGDPLAPAGQRSIDNYFNRNNVVIPDPTQPFGNAGRNIVRGYAFHQFDLGLHKNFRVPLNEESRVEFRMEAFNLFNKTNFDVPNGDRSAAAFGTIRQTFPARQLQFALKLSF